MRQRVGFKAGERGGRNVVGLQSFMICYDVARDGMYKKRGQ